MPLNQDDLARISNDYVTTDPTEGTWRPSRKMQGIPQDFIDEQRFSVLNLKVTKAIALPITTAAADAPLQVTSVTATESPAKAKDGSMVSEVSVSFVVNPSDTKFGSATIWFTGYAGNPNAQEMETAFVSPCTFLVPTPAFIAGVPNTVTVTVQAVSISGHPADFAFAPSTTVALDGVVSAPPAPSTGSLIGTPTGYQFSFNFLAGLSADRVSGYKIYRNTSNSSGTATQISYFPHNPVNTGSQVVNDDGLKNGDLFWYWVTAVNTTGLESALTLVTGSGTVANGVALVSQDFVRNGNFSAGTTNWNLANGVQASNFLTGQSGLPTGNTEFKSDAVSATLESVDFIPVDNNKTYFISCWARIPAGSSVNYGGFAEYDSSKAHIQHIVSSSSNAYALFQALSVTSGPWQYFSALIGGPAVSTPTQYQFAVNTAYVRAIFVLNNAGTPVNVEITDVRISEIGAESLRGLLKVSGTNLISNSDFVNGSTALIGSTIANYGVYDNAASGKVTQSIVSSTTAPNSTGKLLQIVTASGLPAPSPGLGGFMVAIGPDSGASVLGSYHKGSTILWRIKASIPVGYTMQFATNATGNEGTFVWQTSQAGTGGFYDYLALQVIGTTGSFSSTGFFYLDATTAAPVTWQVAVCEAIDISQPQLTNNLHHLTRQGISTTVLVQGSMIPTQAYGPISITPSATSLAITWPSASLFRSDGSTLSVSSGSFTFTSLTPSTSYWIYAYIDVRTGLLGFANPNPPGTSASQAVAAQAGFDGRAMLTPVTVSTPASGTGGVITGGDGGSCPDENELVDVQGKGFIPAGEVKAGDYIKGFSFKTNTDIYRRVEVAIAHSCPAWRIVQGHKVSPCEPVYLNGGWIAAFRVPGSTLDMSVGMKVDISVITKEDNEQNFYLVGGTPLLIHNFTLPRS